MTIKYANGWWGIYGADPFHVPKFNKFIDAVRWAKEWRGFDGPVLSSPLYGRQFPNRLHITAPAPHIDPEAFATFDLYLGPELMDVFGTLAEAIAAAHKLAAAPR